MGEPARPSKYPFGYTISAKPKSANFKVNSRSKEFEFGLFIS